MAITILNGDVLDHLKGLPDCSVQCVVTSPPYWGLRDYGTAKWEGGDPDCKHNPQKPDGGERADRSLPLGRGGIYKDTCGKCGAVRIDNQIGLEKTPEEYTQKMVVVFREVKRVLRDNGTLWLNLGDSYASGKGTCYNPGGGEESLGQERKAEGCHPLDRGNKSTLEESGLKPKDLVGIPWRVAFALQADGWYLRSDIIWSKPNPMPESVTDRPTKAHEYVFLLSKKAKYYYDADAVREEGTNPAGNRNVFRGYGDYTTQGNSAARDGLERQGNMIQGNDGVPTNRNRRTVWEIATQPTPEAHFATFPEALVEPCIKAGTSERGCCPVCGAPWERVVEKGDPLEEQKKSCGADSEGGYNGISQKHKNLMYDGQNPQTMHLKRLLKQDQTGNPTYTGFNARYKQQNASDVKRRILDGMKERISSWQPTCTCGKENTIPCVVLDPFGGSGTTGLVARNLKRDCILIELNPVYVKIMKEKLRLNEQLVV